MKMQLNLSTIQAVGMEYLNRSDNLALSSKSTKQEELSPLQEEYRKFFLGQLEEHGFDRSPAEGNEEELREFFNNIKARWKVRKRELADKGIVGAED